MSSVRSHRVCCATTWSGSRGAAPGNTVALLAFVAVALGGLGAQLGSTAAGFIIGLVSAFAARYWGSYYDNLSVFAVLLLTLLLRPAGISSERQHLAADAAGMCMLMSQWFDYQARLHCRR